MAHVLELHPTPAETPAYRRIRRASRGFSVLFTGLLVLVGVLAVAAALAILFYSGDHLKIGPTSAWIGVGAGPPGYVTFASLGWEQRLAYALASAARSAPALVVLWNLRALFRLYAAGVVFARDNAGHFLWIGVALIAHALAPLACHLALSATGAEIDHRWFHLASLQALVLGGLVIVIAQVMQVGREIEEERGGFV